MADPNKLDASNDIIILKWPQIVYGISILVLIILTYSDMKSTLNITQNSITELNKKIDKVYTRQETDFTVLQLQQTDKKLSQELKQIKKKLRMDIGDFE